jgi:hypothetical protein
MELISGQAKARDVLLKKLEKPGNRESARRGGKLDSIVIGSFVVLINSIQYS